MTPVERVARALFERNKARSLTPSPVTWDTLHPDTRSSWTESARAAITALAEAVGDEMVGAACTAIDDHHDGSLDATFEGGVEAAIRAALLAALEQKK